MSHRLTDPRACAHLASCEHCAVRLDMDAEILVRMTECNLESQRYLVNGEHGIHKVTLSCMENERSGLAITEGNTYVLHTDMFIRDFAYEHVLVNFVCYECSVMLLHTHTRSRFNGHKCRGNCVCYRDYCSHRWDMQCLSSTAHCVLNIFDTEQPILTNFENLFFTAEGQLCFSLTSYGTHSQIWPLQLRQPCEANKRIVLGYLYYTCLRDNKPFVFLEISNEKYEKS